MCYINFFFYILEKICFGLTYLQKYGCQMSLRLLVGNQWLGCHKLGNLTSRRYKHSYSYTLI